MFYEMWEVLQGTIFDNILYANIFKYLLKNKSQYIILFKPILWHAF